jgi:glycosyltransferase involved in cell wall biosynthesis
MAMAIISKRTYSIAAHARDVFVERGAIEVKLFYTSFLITCCQYTLDYLKRILPPDFHHKLFLNYHGINLEPYSSFGHTSKSVNCNTHRLLFVGRLVPKKGVEHLLKAFAVVLVKQPECLLLVAGDGPDFDTLVELAKKLNIENQIRFLGWQEAGSIGRLMQSSTALVVPSTFARDGDRDGVPNVILEAFANSLPVIANGMSGITEAVIPLKTGLLVKPGDVEELTNAIEKLLQDAHLREQLARKACRLLKDKFDLTKNVEYLANLFMDKTNAASKN